MKKSFIFAISAFLYVFVMGLFFNKVSVIASELEEEAFEVIDQKDGYLSLDEEDQQDSEQVLHDYIYEIKSVKPLGSSRSVLTNTIPDITPDPTPTAEPTPTPNPEGGQVVINKDFENIIIFCFGIIAGIMIGKLLLGFVK